MASMVFALSPLSAQSLVKLRTNSNYPRSSCYVPLHSKKNSYVHLCYNISHIESSKSSFTKDDGFSKFSLLKFPRVASTLSPSLNIIKASMGGIDGDHSIYRFDVCKLEKQDYVKPTDIPLSYYTGKVLLIVNIPQQGSEWSEREIKYLNELRRVYRNEFEVLGFLYGKNELDEEQEHGGPHASRSFFAKVKALIRPVKNELDEKSEAGILKILRSAEFPIFREVELNKEYGHIDVETGKQPKLGRATQRKEDKDLMNTTISGGEKEIKIKEDFEKILVDRHGIPIRHYPPFDYETSKSHDVQSGGDYEMSKSQDVQSGGDPGSGTGPRDDLRETIKNDIAECLKKR